MWPSERPSCYPNHTSSTVCSASKQNFSAEGGKLHLLVVAATTLGSSKFKFRM